MSKVACYFSTAVLLTAVLAVVLLSGGNVSRVPPVGPLASLLPTKLLGVEVDDVPLGPKEADGAAREIMDYDDVVHRSYTSAAGSFTVYVGYWARGRRSPSHIAAHTPDRCWTLAGMTCLQRQENFQLSINGKRLAPGYWRRFRQPGGPELEAVFWHVVGNGFYNYGGTLHDYTPPLQRVANVVRDLFAWRTDQYFIRIASTRPIVDFAGDPVFDEVMNRVEKLGLIAR